ncbi:MAG TPA: hypothetical protein VGB03_07655, partial [Acidimicrobiales bacterium]
MRHRARGLLFLPSLLFVVLARPAVAAETVTPQVPGFTAAKLGEFGGTPCGEAGPTGVAVRQGSVYIAAGILYTSSPGGGLTALESGLSPWGLAATPDGRLFATQPSCNQQEQADPVNGS